MNIYISILYIILIEKFLYPFTVRYFGLPVLPSFVLQFLIFGLFITIYLTKYFNKKNFVISDKFFKRYKYVILFFLEVIIVSSLINKNNILLVLKSIFNYDLIYLLLFLSVIELGLNEKVQEKLIKFIYALIFLQVPVTIFQYFIIGYSDADAISGTIATEDYGGTGIIAIIMSFGLAFSLALLLIKGFSIIRLLLTLSTTIPVIAGGARISLLLFPLTICTTVISFYLLKRSKKTFIFVKGLLVVSVFLFIIYFIFIKLAPQTKMAKFFDFETISNVNEIEKYDSGRDYKDSRIQGYYFLFNETLSNSVNVLFGIGNEAITQSKSAGVNHIKLNFLFSKPDAMIFLATTGALGLGFVIILLLLSIPTLNEYLEYEYSKLMIVISSSFIPVTLNVIISLFYTSAWSTQIGLIYWILLGILFQRAFVLNKSNILQKTMIDHDKTSLTVAY